MCRFPFLTVDGHPQAIVVLYPCSLSQGSMEATMEITWFVSSFLIYFHAPSWIMHGGVLPGRFLYCVAQGESHMARCSHV